MNRYSPTAIDPAEITQRFTRGFPLLSSVLTHIDISCYPPLSRENRDNLFILSLDLFNPSKVKLRLLETPSWNDNSVDKIWRKFFGYAKNRANCICIYMHIDIYTGCSIRVYSMISFIGWIIDYPHSFNLVLFGFQAKLEWMGTLFTRSTMNNCNRNIGHALSITRWKEGGDRFLNSVHSPNSISTHFRFTGSEQIAQHDGWILTGYDHCRPRHGPLPLYYDSYLSSSTSFSFFPRRFNSHNRFLLRGKVKRRREPTMRHREVRCQLNRGYRDISHSFLFRE